MKTFLSALRLFVVLTVLCGVIYPALVWGAGRVAFRNAADGSPVRVGDKIVGSSLVGQNFTGPGLFRSRPSAAGKTGYDGMASSGSNAGPNNPDFLKTVGERSAEFGGKAVPNDLVTASGSGLDPDITPEAALFQVPRIARETGRTEESLKELIRKNTVPPVLGLLGEPRVNVLMLNLALREGR